jgi:hypothetical protein
MGDVRALLRDDGARRVRACSASTSCRVVALALFLVSCRSGSTRSGSRSCGPRAATTSASASLFFLNRSRRPTCASG